MTEIEYIKELVEENTVLRETIFEREKELDIYDDKIGDMFREIHKVQVEEAKYSFTTKEDVYKVKIPVEKICEILSLNAGICEEALAILKAKEIKNDD